MVELLLRNGADPTVITKEGDTPSSSRCASATPSRRHPQGRAPGRCSSASRPGAQAGVRFPSPRCSSARRFRFCTGAARADPAPARISHRGLASVPNARSLALGAKGTSFVGSRSGGAVHAVAPAARYARSPTACRMPNGVAFRDGALYIAEVGRSIASMTLKQSSSVKTQTRLRQAARRRAPRLEVHPLRP
jgi:hypothetical protein